MKILAALLLFATVAHADTTAASAKIDPAKEKDIRALLELTGAAKLGTMIIDQMFEPMKKMQPNLPAEFWTDLKKEMRPDELIDLVVPIYDRQLTDGEIRDLIKFYQTPTGKKLVRVMPQLTQDSMVVGKQWGAQLGARIMKRIQERSQAK
jgi:hypothetical protein